MNDEPKETPAQKPHFGPGAHFFNMENWDKLSPEERRKVLEHILDVMDGEDKKRNEDGSDQDREEKPS